MVRTGARALALREALLAAGLTPGPPPERPQLASLPATLVDELLGLYRQLGGKVEAPSLRPGAWDLSFAGPIVVELDEELHFNRYRAMTLAASWCGDLPWSSDYITFCDKYEGECTSAGSWGKRWTNPSCERMFGIAGQPGDLTGPGAPRWKQRALYDAVKDIAPVLNDSVRLARVSVYDRVDGITIGDVVTGHASVDPQALRKLIEDRTA